MIKWLLKLWKERLLDERRNIIALCLQLEQSREYKQETIRIATQDITAKINAINVLLG